MLALLLTLSGVYAQHDMGQFTGGSGPPAFVPPEFGPKWWPAQEFVAASGKLKPNPGASMFSFQFNGPEHGKNFITLPRSLSAELPRSMTIEAWIWLPAAANRASAQAFLPIVSRFNVRLTTGPAELDAYNDFGLQIENQSGALRFWMGGQHSEAFGFDMSSSQPVPTEQWTHVAVSVVSSESRNPYYALLFIDGKQVGSANWRSGAVRVFQTNEAIALGYRQKGDNETNYFEGLIDEVRIWGVAKKAAELADAMHKHLDGDEDGLVALYRLDDTFGGTILDSTAAMHHGYTIKPLWTLGAPPTIHRQETGVQGFAVDIPLTAVDLVPTAPAGFEYQLDCLPKHGCVFAADDAKKTCAAEADLGTRIFPAGVIKYTGDDGYLGDDQICYRARRVGEQEWSQGAFIDINVIAPPPSGCLTKFDQCGVCGGDGTSCTTGGCDGKGGKFDACMVCGGDSSTCMCAVYKTYKLSEMDCILFDHAVNRTMVRIENSINLLADTLQQLASYDVHSPLDLMQQVRHLCGIRPCLSHYSDELAVFDDYVGGFLKTAYLCPEPEPRKLLSHAERTRQME